MMDIGLICTLGLSPQESGCGAADTHRTRVWAVVGRSPGLLTDQSPKCLASE